MRSLLKALSAAALLLVVTGCRSINDDRIPRMAVNIDLSNQGIWNSYGVNGFGSFNTFILANGIVEPAGFPYIYNSATGYGGVLLIYGQNPYTTEVGPLAYDLSCPVERLPNVRVYVDLLTLDAVCPECDSHYNVIEAGGTPISGPAKEMNYAMSAYQCLGTVTGGYIITN